jgi:hypothetical protein
VEGQDRVVGLDDGIRNLSWGRKDTMRISALDLVWICPGFATSNDTDDVRTLMHAG